MKLFDGTPGLACVVGAAAFVSIMAFGLIGNWEGVQAYGVVLAAAALWHRTLREP